MNDLPQYLRDNNCPSVTLGNHPFNCLMYVDVLLLISPSPEGRLQQSLNVLYKHAQEWKLKVNTKKSNVIIFSGNGQSKYKGNFKYENEILNIADRQTYLGLEMKSYHLVVILTPGRFSAKKRRRFQMATIKRFLSNSDTTAISIKNKLFDAVVKPILLYARSGDL